MPDDQPTFVGSAPGEHLTSVLERLTEHDLRSIIGLDVLKLADRDWSRSELAEVAAKILRNEPSELTAPKLAKLLLRNLEPEKKEEFERRLAFAGGNASSDQERADFLSRFLGVGSDGASIREAAEPTSRLSPKFGLFEHQRSVVRRARKRLSGGNGRTLIHMPTGSGKTRTAMHLIAQTLNETEPCLVVWLASGRELLEQASEAFATAWQELGNRELGNFRFWGDHDPDIEDMHDGLLVAGLQKMHFWRQSNPLAAMRLSSRTKLVVVDEAHQAIAPSYRRTIEGLTEGGQNDALLGLSATPGRTWSDVEADEKLAAFFHDSKVVLEISGAENPVQYLIDEGYLSSPHFGRIDYSEVESIARPLPPFDAEEITEIELDRLAADEARNRAILEAVYDLTQRGHKRVILFAASVKHAKLLSRALNIDGLSAAVVTGETPLAERRRIIDSYRRGSQQPKVLCNFGVLTTGFDAPCTSAAIIARPTRSLVLFSQMVGRATRGPKAGGNERSEVLTVHDPDCPGFGDIAKAFFNWEDVWSE